MRMQTPDIVLRNAWQRIPKNIKVTFISSFIIGLITHMYMITNTLPNHDEFKNMAESLAWGVEGTGRWFLPVVGAITGIFSLPWVNGLITIFFFSISACLVVSMTKVKSNLYSALIAGIMITIPMVASFMTYMGGAPSNVSTIMLACFAAFLASRYKYGFIFGTIPIVLSLAVYQVSFGVTAALMVLVLIMEVLDNQISWKKTLLNGVKYVATLIGGLLLYLATIRILHPYGLPGGYQGLNEMGQIDWVALPSQIRRAYLVIARFFLDDYWNYHYPFMNILFALSFAACAALVIMLCLRKKLFREPMKVALLAILLLLFPFSCNLIYIMGAHWIHDLMIYPTVFIFVFLLVIVDRYIREQKKPTETAHIDNHKKSSKKPDSIIASISAWVITITIAISMFNYGILTNQVYFRLNIGYQVTYAQSILLLSKIQSLEGFTTDKDIVIVGSPEVPQGIPELQDITIIGANGPELLLDSWAYPYFLRRHLNFTQDIRYVRGQDIWLAFLHGQEEIIELTEFVRGMPVFPHEGSMKIVDNTIYVRFAHLGLPPYRDG